MANEIVGIEKLNEVFWRLTCSDPSILNRIYEHFKVMVEGAQFSPTFKQGIWDGKVSFYDRRASTLPFGLWPRLIEWIQNNQLQYVLKNTTLNQLTTNSVFSPALIQMFHDTKVKQIHPDPNFNFRDYQLEAVDKVLQFKKAVALLATGAGKSAIIYMITRLLYATGEANKILIVVPNVGLVSQLASNFIDDYGYTQFNELGYTLSKDTKEKDKKAISNPKGMDRPFLITTYQSVMKKGLNFFEQFDALIIDEVHGVNNSGKSLQGISRKCYQAKYKIGLTGTLGENQADVLTTAGYVGPVVYTLKSKTLIDKGHLSELAIKSIILRYPDSIIKELPGKDYNSEVSFIEAREERNDILLSLFKNFQDHENILVLARHIDHMKELAEFLKANLPDDYTVELIYCSIKGNKREAIRNNMNNSTKFVLVASFATTATGINIPNLHHIIFAASYKAKIKCLQAIGRSLRKSSNKTKAYVWDMVDDFSTIQKSGRRVNKNYIFKHYEKRISFYNEQEFDNEEITINIDELNI